MAEESKSGMMMMLGRSLLDLGKIDSLEEVLHSIESVTPLDIQEIAKEIFAPEGLSWLVYEPKAEEGWVVEKITTSNDFESQPLVLGGY